MAIPTRIVVFSSPRSNAEIHTTFDLQVNSKYPRQYTDLGQQLHTRLANIPGINRGEMSVQLEGHMIFLSKLVAFEWDEIIPQVVAVLTELYDLKKIDVRYQSKT